MLIKCSSNMLYKSRLANAKQLCFVSWTMFCCYSLSSLAYNNRYYMLLIMMITNIYVSYSGRAWVQAHQVEKMADIYMRSYPAVTILLTPLNSCELHCQVTDRPWYCADLCKDFTSDLPADRGYCQHSHNPLLWNSQTHSVDDSIRFWLSISGNSSDY